MVIAPFWTSRDGCKMMVSMSSCLDPGNDPIMVSSIFLPEISNRHIVRFEIETRLVVPSMSPNLFMARACRNHSEAQQPVFNSRWRAIAECHCADGRACEINCPTAVTGGKTMSIWPAAHIMPLLSLIIPNSEIRSSDFLRTSHIPCHHP